ncbi:Dual-specificity kinase, spindle pole body (SPB) duplication and spindle checkpoint function [Linnemannia zychae]|nr:Dual-specificity kinase, spindle pole body (SPB) duplication and spindle checkpoint function [Linnemannia zychae]
MTDLESRDKKRGPPPKLLPINVGQPKDKEAHLADYFGEGSLLAASSINIRPIKRNIFAKINSNTTSHPTTTGPALAIHNTRDINSGSASTSTGIDSKDRDSAISASHSNTSTIIPRTGHHAIMSDKESGVDTPKTLLSSGSTNTTDTSVDSSNVFRLLRSSSRLSRQEPYQKKEFAPLADLDKPILTESISAVSEPKVVFSQPPSRISRNTEGKENLTPRTSLASRTNIRKSISTRSSAPRKSLNWGLPQREAIVEPEEQDDQEESKRSAPNISDDGALPTTSEKIADTTTGATVATSIVPSISDDSGTSSVELAIQDLQVEEAVVGSGLGSNSEPARIRQGIKRDLDEANLVTKRRKEFHPLDDPSRISIKRTSFGTISSPPSPRLAMSPPPRLSEQRSFTDAKGRSNEEITSSQSVGKHEQIERIAEPPKSPQDYKAAFHFPLPRGPSSHSSHQPTQQQQLQQQLQQQEHLQQHEQAQQHEQLQQQQLPSSLPSQQQQQQQHQQQRHQHHPQPSLPQQRPHGDGIASIAQSLAVGAPKSVMLPRPSSSSQELPVRSGNVIIPSSSTTSSPNLGRPELGPRHVMMVNNRPYTRLQQVGKGGSSRVFKVLSSYSKIMALKKVTFDRADQAAIDGYVNEVRLLLRLNKNPRIVKFFDAEINHQKNYLCLVMEYGEIDLANMLANQQTQPFDIHFIGLYWRQMLEAVQVIHDLKIVHSDLKPANFLLVEGTLKLIDFGIANLISNDTTNIQREGQLGTANYMSPEAISANPAAGGYRKMGRPTDVWALGCILYQMIYGRTPFSDVTNVFRKLSAITNPDYQIPFPTTVRSPLIIKDPNDKQSQQQVQQSQAAMNGAGEENGRGLIVATTGADGVTTTQTINESSSSSETLPPTPITPIVPRIVTVDPNLIQTMKNCLAYKASDRITIPELLADPFLQPYASAPLASSSSPSADISNQDQGLPDVMGTGAEPRTKTEPATGVNPETRTESVSGAGTGLGVITATKSGESVTMDVDTLQELIHATMTFGAKYASSSPHKTSAESGRIEEETVKSVTGQILRQLHSRQKANNSRPPGRFVITE